MRFITLCYGDLNVWDQYVDKLHRGIARHYTGDMTFEVMDNFEGWPEKGCWPKIQAFAPGYITSPATYIDLDSVIVGSLDWLDEPLKYPLAMPQFACKLGQPQACLIQFRGDDVSACYDRDAHLRYKGRQHDQSYLTRFWGEWLGESKRGQVISYKHEAHLAPQASVVQFHGRLKPHHVPNDPIVLEHWL